MHIIIKKKYLVFNDYRVKCAIGKRGIKIKKKEGDLITPKGTYNISKLLYRKDRVKNLKSRLKKILINKNMGWCDDPRSKDYNKLIKIPFKYNYEKLYIKENIYDIILVLNYNMQPVKKDKGSAIFIHIAKQNFNPTKGCVAIRKKELRVILKMVNARTKVKII
ncbi:L,D-transpeptidase family protein [Pelagibacteraceae bacterium]|nr:L,D-transpeptidase family protein [Pelagibacteraceae bacterium]